MSDQIRNLRPKNFEWSVFVSFQFPAIGRHYTEKCVRLNASAFIRKCRVCPGQPIGVTSKAPIATDGYPLIFALRPMRFASAATRVKSDSLRNSDCGQIERVLKSGADGTRPQYSFYTCSARDCRLRKKKLSRPEPSLMA